MREYLIQGRAGEVVIPAKNAADLLDLIKEVHTEDDPWPPYAKIWVRCRAIETDVLETVYGHER